MSETAAGAAGATTAEDKKGDKPPVDNATLAFMLRESADIVEKGEFDVILYHALQDFRTYYKLHLPKRKVKHKKKEATATANKSSASSSAAKAESKDKATGSAAAAASTAAAPAPTTSPEPSAPPANADAPVANGTSASEESTKPNNAPVEEAVKRETSAAESTAVSEDTATTISTTTTPAPSGGGGGGGGGGTATDPLTTSAAEKTAASIPGTEDHPIDAESGRMDSADSILESGRAAEEFTNEASLRDATTEDKSKGKHSITSPLAKKASAATKSVGKFSAGMFASKNKMKLPKKLPKMHLHVNLPSSAKKKRESELVGLTGGDVAQFAESSRRRAAANDADAEDDYPYHHHDDRTHNNLQPAVTGLGNPEPPISTSATQTEIPVDRVRGHHSEPADKGNNEPPSSRNNDEIPNASATNNASEVEPPVPPPAPATSVPSFASTSASSDAFVSDPAPEHFDPEMPENGHSKPAFQRPKSKNSAVMANGWIEQQRRSKMRTVWKEVLASLVQGRRPGEETTLWIQRETVNAATGKKELEALHQIPIKLLESVVYSEFTTDDRFSLKLLNSPEEFVFRCNNDPSAAMNWVTILQQLEMEAKKGAMNGGQDANADSSMFPDYPEDKKAADPTPNNRSRSSTPNRMAIRDLRAICHGAGINTAGMERADLERAAAEVQSRGTFFAPPTAGHAAANSIPAAAHAAPTAPNAPTAPPHVPPRSRSPSPAPRPTAPVEPSAPPANGATSKRMSIKDLRAICHGAGISTVGMERGELERAAAEVQSRGTYFAPPPSAAPAKHDDEAAKQEEMRRRQAAEDEARRRAEEEHWRRHEEETRRRAAEDEHRRRAEEEHRRRLAEEEHRRRMAEQQAQQAEAQRRRYAEQQAAWQHQQQHEEQRRRMAEQQAAEQRRRHEEAMRKQQQWAGQQPQHHQQPPHQGWTRQPPQQQPPHHPQQQQGWSRHPPQQQTHAQQQHHQHWQQQQQWHQQQQQQQQHYQQQHARPQAPPPQQHQHAPPPQQQSKYAKMANQSDDDGQAAITKLKHDILIQWALQPPQLQMLRSVDVLLSTIQNVFPPALGVPAHDYFKKWKVVTRESVLSDAGIIDEEKVKKAVRKLRFFLHPDKLPKDLNSEQQFMVKMLWDITNDAWEEYQKSKEDLDWVK